MTQISRALLQTLGQPSSPEGAGGNLSTSAVGLDLPALLRDLAAEPLVHINDASASGASRLTFLTSLSPDQAQGLHAALTKAAEGVRAYLMLSGDHLEANTPVAVMAGEEETIEMPAAQLLTLLWGLALLADFTEAQVKAQMNHAMFLQSHIRDRRPAQRVVPSPAHTASRDALSRLVGQMIKDSQNSEAPQTSARTRTEAALMQMLVVATAKIISPESAAPGWEASFTEPQLPWLLQYSIHVEPEAVWAGIYHFARQAGAETNFWAGARSDKVIRLLGAIKDEALNVKDETIALLYARGRGQQHDRTSTYRAYMLSVQVIGLIRQGLRPSRAAFGVRVPQLIKQISADVDATYAQSLLTRAERQMYVMPLEALCALTWKANRSRFSDSLEWHEGVRALRVLRIRLPESYVEGMVMESQARAYQPTSLQQRRTDALFARLGRTEQEEELARAAASLDAYVERVLTAEMGLRAPARTRERAARRLGESLASFASSPYSDRAQSFGVAKLTRALKVWKTVQGDAEAIGTDLSHLELKWLTLAQALVSARKRRQGQLSRARAAQGQK